MKKYFAFTLAEVLITLGIIGVIAAMTLPVLTNQYSDSVLKTQNKKAKSILSNGIKLRMANEEVTDLRNTTLKQCGNDKACLEKEIKKAFKVIADNSSSNDLYSSKYKFTDGDKEFWTDSSMSYVFTVPDGAIFGVLSDENEGTMSFVTDVNGNKTPNRGSKDLCKLTVSITGNLSENCEVMANWQPTRICDIDHLDQCNEEECYLQGELIREKTGSMNYGTCWNDANICHFTTGGCN